MCIGQGGPHWCIDQKISNCLTEHLQFFGNAVMRQTLTKTVHHKKSHCCSTTKMVQTKTMLMRKMKIRHYKCALPQTNHCAAKISLNTPMKNYMNHRDSCINYVSLALPDNHFALHMQNAVVRVMTCVALFEHLSRLVASLRDCTGANQVSANADSLCFSTSRAAWNHTRERFSVLCTQPLSADNA